MPKFFMYYFVPFKDCWRRVETWHDYSNIVGQQVYINSQKSKFFYSTQQRDFQNLTKIWVVLEDKFCKYFVIKPWKFFFQFTSDRQHVFWELKVVLVVFSDIALVILQTRNFADWNHEKSEKRSKVLMHHFLSFKGCKTAAHVPIN